MKFNFFHNLHTLNKSLTQVYWCIRCTESLSCLCQEHLIFVSSCSCTPGPLYTDTTVKFLMSVFVICDVLATSVTFVKLLCLLDQSTSIF